MVRERVGRQGVFLGEGAQIDDVRVAVGDGGRDAVGHVLRAAFLRHDAEGRDRGDEGVRGQGGEDSTQALFELTGGHVLGHDVVAADGERHQVGAVGAVQQAQAAHLRDLGEFDRLDGRARQGEVEQENLAVQLGVDGRGEACRVGLGDARGAHALHGGVAEGDDQVGTLAFGMLVKLTQAIQGRQIVVLPRLAVVTALGIQPQETSNGQAAAKKARAAGCRARYLPCSFADPHRNVLPSCLLMLSVTRPGPVLQMLKHRPLGLSQIAQSRRPAGAPGRDRMKWGGSQPRSA